MLGLLLFAILVVLLIVTGLLPGVLSAIGSMLSIVVLIMIFTMMGWAYALGGIVLCGIALFALHEWDKPERQRRRYLKRCGLDPKL